MMNVRKSIFAALFAAAGLWGATASAQTGAQVFIENAKTWGGGDTLYLFGLPVKNAEGKPSYWDVQIKLEAAADTGKPNAASLSSVVKSPNLKKAEFLPGDYTVGSSACTLTASPFIGRNQYDLRCDNNYLVITWYTGGIAGHPFEAELRAAGLDQIPGSDQLSWGRVMVVRANPWGGCSLGAGHLLSARQVGDALTINSYGGDNVLNCQVNFVRAPI